MVFGWRKVFCTSIPSEPELEPEPDSTAMEEVECELDVSKCYKRTPKCGTGFGFFSSPSNSSTPRLRCRTTDTVPALSPTPSVTQSPELRYDTMNSPRFSLASPRAFLKSSLRLRTRKCGLCSQTVKKGQGTATFTAECSHTFHFPCISDHVKTQGSLACPVCTSLWTDMPMLSLNTHKQKNHFPSEQNREKLATRFNNNAIRPELKVYNDDEPLTPLTPTARFNPIPESDENNDGEFRGFWNHGGDTSTVNHDASDFEVRISSETVLIDACRRHETHAVFMKVKVPVVMEKAQRRAPVDLVTVIDVSGKITNTHLQKMKIAMRTIVSSLSSSDRLSIVAFSSHSKRLLPLRRMTGSGRRAARCIVDAMAVIEGESNSKDAVKKGVKVLLDRREKNAVAGVILLSEIIRQSSICCSYSRMDFRIHSLKLGGLEEVMIRKCIGNLLNVVVQDLRMQLGFISGAPAVVAAVYSRTQPVVLGLGTVEIGELSANEERELLVEVKVPARESAPVVSSHRLLSVRFCYKEPLTQEVIYGKHQNLTVPRLTTVRSSSVPIQRLRNIFVSTRALAESRRLTEGNDLTGAYNVLVSARGLIKQSNPAPDEELVLGLEAELKQLQQRLGVAPVVYRDEKGEPLTPTSAWRVADKLAKVAMMRKSVNRVGDLHGFEDARF